MPLSCDQLYKHSKWNNHQPSVIIQWRQTFLSSCCVVCFGGESRKPTAQLSSSTFLVKALCASPALSFLWLMLCCLWWSRLSLCEGNPVLHSFAPLWYSGRNAVLSGGFHVVHFWQTFSWNSSLTHSWLLLLAAYSTSIEGHTELL